MPPKTTQGFFRAAARVFSILLVLLAVLILARAVPLARIYLEKLRSLHGTAGSAAGVLAAAAAVAALTAGILLRPKATGAAVAAGALLLVALSGNAGALLAALAIVAVTFLAGDAVSRILLGREAGEGDLSSVFGAGIILLGLAPLLLGEIGLWRRTPLVVFAALLSALRWRRLAPLARIARRTVCVPSGDSPGVLEASWLAVTLLFLSAAWVGALAPDFSFDALAYHLPEARDLAQQGSVEPIHGLAPQSLLWHNEENFLSLGFLFGGVRVARLLQFFVGLGTFGAVLALARRLSARGAGPLALLSLAAFPAAVLQMRGTYVDWPAAFLVAAAAAEIAASREEPRRLLLAGFLFGGAVVTKLFAVLAAPALFLLYLRRGGVSARRLLLPAAGILLAAIPWLAWSQSRAGFPLAPFWSPRAVPVAMRGLFRSVPRDGIPGREDSVAGFLRTPYDLTFHSHVFEKNGDGYDGMLPLLLVPGVVGWGAAGTALFLGASLPVLVPWFRLADPSVRYLIPLYPLYGLFAANGVVLATRRFAGRAGLAAGAALTVTALSFPVQLGSSGVEWKVAAGLMSREAALEARVPSYRFWKKVRPDDRVVFIGEWDFFHCPTRWIERAFYHPIVNWGSDSDTWRRGLSRMRVDWVVESERSREDLVAALLGNTLELVDRNGASSLYRVVRSAPASSER